MSSINEYLKSIENDKSSATATRYLERKQKIHSDGFSLIGKTNNVNKLNVF